MAGRVGARLPRTEQGTARSAGRERTSPRCVFLLFDGGGKRQRHMKLLEDHDAALRAEIQRLRGVCYEAYQFASCVGAPTRILDNLSDASRGEPLRHETILPVSAEECDEIQRLTTDETEWIRLKLELDATIQRLTTELSALRTRLEAHERVMEQYWSHP